MTTPKLKARANKSETEAEVEDRVRNVSHFTEDPGNADRLETKGLREV